MRLLNMYDIKGGLSGCLTDLFMSFVEDAPRETLIKLTVDYVLCSRKLCNRFVLSSGD